MSIVKQIRSVLVDDKGATAVEYGLIAAMIVIAMISGMSAFANATNGMWTKVQTSVENAR